LISIIYSLIALSYSSTPFRDIVNVLLLPYLDFEASGGPTGVKRLSAFNGAFSS